MNCYGVSVNLKNIPELDPEFTPLLKFNEAFLKDATKPVSIAVERVTARWLPAIQRSMKKRK